MWGKSNKSKILMFNLKTNKKGPSQDLTVLSYFFVDLQKGIALEGWETDFTYSKTLKKDGKSSAKSSLSIPRTSGNSHRAD